MKSVSRFGISVLALSSDSRVRKDMSETFFFVRQTTVAVACSFAWPADSQNGAIPPRDSE